MQFPAEPLSEAEEEELGLLLEQSGSVPLVHVRGVFSAVACEPSLQDPTDWLPLVLGSDVPDQSTLKSIFKLLIRDLTVTAQCLALGQPDVPAARDHDAVTQFCKGFMRVTQASKVWQNDPDALELVLPLAVLAGYLKLESLQELHPEVELDAANWPADTRRGLPERLLQIFGHFEHARRQQAPIRNERVGRNEPCPCGSGKKYKKCCGLSE